RTWRTYGPQDGSCRRRMAGVPAGPEVPPRLPDGRVGRAARAVRPGSVYADHPGDLLKLEPGRPLLHRGEPDIRPAADRPPRRAVTVQEARFFPSCPEMAGASLPRPARRAAVCAGPAPHPPRGPASS